MATIKGRAVCWSIGGITFTAGIVSTASADFPQNYRFSRNSNKTEIKDDGDTIRTQVFSAFKKTFSITVVPCALGATNTIANANTSADSHLPVPGTTITVVDAAGAIIDGSYNTISATLNKTVDGVATVDLELEQGDESNDLTTAVS